MLSSLKNGLKKCCSEQTWRLAVAVMCGCTVGLIISICIPKISQNTESDRKKIEIEAIERYREELKTSSESYIELLRMLRTNVQNNPGRYQVIVEDTQKKIEELEEEIGIINKLNMEELEK